MLLCIPNEYLENIPENKFNAKTEYISVLLVVDRLATTIERIINSSAGSYNTI